MRRLVLASCDTITLKTHFINAVKATINEGEPALNTVTIGMDLGDKNHALCILDKTGKVIKQTTITNTSSEIKKFFARYKGVTIALEAGTHSPWISRQLAAMGCMFWWAIRENYGLYGTVMTNQTIGMPKC